MKDDEMRFVNRFQALFDTEGLMNIKFFIRDASGLALDTFMEEVNKIEDTIAAGDFRKVDSIDGALETRRFDDPF